MTTISLEIDDFNGDTHELLFDSLYFKNVFVPSVFSLLLASRMEVGKGNVVLDAGTGSGIHALLALKMGAKEANALDLNPFAIRAAERNARLNGLSEGLHTIYGDMRQYLAEKPQRLFDAIITDPPQLQGTEEQEKDADWEELSYLAGRDGRRYVDFIIANSRNHLVKGGKLEFATTSVVNYPLTLKMLQEHGFKLLRTSKIEVPFRAVYILAKPLIDDLQTTWGEKLYDLREAIPYETIYSVIAEAT